MQPAENKMHDCSFFIPDVINDAIFEEGKECLFVLPREFMS